MKKSNLFTLILVIIIGIGGYFYYMQSQDIKELEVQTEELKRETWRQEAKSNLMEKD